MKTLNEVLSNELKIKLNRIINSELAKVNDSNIKNLLITAIDNFKKDNIENISDYFSQKNIEYTTLLTNLDKFSQLEDYLNYINDVKNILTWDEIKHNDNIIKLISNKGFNKNMLLNLLLSKGQDEKSLGVGIGEYILICFIKDCIKSYNKGDLMIPTLNNLKIECKGMRARIPVNKYAVDFYKNLQEDAYYNIELNNFSGKKSIQSFLNKNNIDNNQKLEKLLYFLSKSCNIFITNINLKHNNENIVNTVIKYLTAFTIIKYQLDEEWDDLIIFNNNGYYKILDLSTNEINNKLIKCLEFLNSIKIEQGIKYIGGHNGFQLTLL